MISKSPTEIKSFEGLLLTYNFDFKKGIDFITLKLTLIPRGSEKSHGKVGLQCLLFALDNCSKKINHNF
jgi:hypothetical protein